jgi:hypothetical protein
LQLASDKRVVDGPNIGPILSIKIRLDSGSMNLFRFYFSTMDQWSNFMGLTHTGCFMSVSYGLVQIERLGSIQTMHDARF